MFTSPPLNPPLNFSQKKDTTPRGTRERAKRQGIGGGVARVKKLKKIKLFLF